MKAAPTVRTSSASSSPRRTSEKSFPDERRGHIQHLALYVEDLDAAVEHLRGHGVELMSGQIRYQDPKPGREIGSSTRERRGA
jgi:4-hydroxyphenylpyruvate dioxygenase-like putative hemolysin